jgi:hypothetical protein
METVTEALSTGERLANAGEREAGLLAYERALIIDPLNIKALAAVPRLQHDLGLISAAIASYGIYLDRDPLRADYVVSLSILLMQEGDEEGAWKTIIRYVNAGGGDSVVALNAAYLASFFGRANVARDIVFFLLNREPNDINLLLAAVEVAGLNGDYRSVIRFAEQIQHMNPTVSLSSRRVNIPYLRLGAA